MTAFEILLNKFYDCIVSNEPPAIKQNTNSDSSELFANIKQFIDMSFFHGHKLTQQEAISASLSKSGALLQQADHEDWSYVRYIFMENGLNTIDKDHNSRDIQHLKMNLDNTLFGQEVSF